MKRLLACLIVISFMNAGCDDSKPKPKNTLKEVIDVRGTCWENHVLQKDIYAGQIVRWQAADTGKILTYGSVTIPSYTERLLDEVTHPTVYHMPFVISFDQIDIDTEQPRWTIHGVSDRGENTQGYDSTCEVEVVKRGTDLSNIHMPGQ